MLRDSRDDLIVIIEVDGGLVGDEARALFFDNIRRRVVSLEEYTVSTANHAPWRHVMLALTFFLRFAGLEGEESSGRSETSSLRAESRRGRWERLMGVGIVTID